MGGVQYSTVGALRLPTLRVEVMRLNIPGPGQRSALGHQPGGNNLVAQRSLFLVDAL